MKTLLLALSLTIGGFVLSLLSGCASTRITVTKPDGTRVEFRCTKNVALESLTLRDGELEIKKLASDASSVIREQNVGVTAVAGAVSEAAKVFAPLP